MFNAPNPCTNCGQKWKYDQYCPHAYGTKRLYELREKTTTILIMGDNLVHLDENDFPLDIVKIKELTPTHASKEKEQ